MALGREILYNIHPSGYSGFHLPCFPQHVQHQHLPLDPPGRVTVPARSPSAGIPSKAIGLPGIMLATLGVRPAGRLGPNPYHPSPKVTNIPLDKISTPLLNGTSGLLPLTNLLLSQLLTPTVMTVTPCRQCCSTQPIIKIP